MTIYIPVSVEKELPEELQCKNCKGYGYTVEPVCCNRPTQSGECCGIPEPMQEMCPHCRLTGLSPNFKSFEISELISHVESFIAPQREDMREYAKEGIISFFNKFLNQ